MKLKSTIKHTSLIMIVAVATISIFVLNGCSKMNESVANENIQLPTSTSRNLKNLFSYLEVVEMINSTKSNYGIKRSTFDTLESLIHCKLLILDSLTNDGDGFQYKVVFPEKTELLNPSLKNYDGNYRFGSFIVDLNFNYRELNSISTIKLDSNDGCFIANNQGEFTQIFGDFKYERIITNKINLTVNQSTIIYKYDQPMQIKGDFTVTWTDGETTDGILNDVMIYNGKGTGTYFFESFNWNTSLPLEKNLEYGCASNIVKGVLQIESLISKKIFRVDFDPFNNKSCDSIIKIYVLGKEYEITI